MTASDDALSNGISAPLYSKGWLQDSRASCPCVVKHANFSEAAGGELKRQHLGNLRATKLAVASWLVEDHE